MSDFHIADNLHINVDALAREGKRWVVAGKTGEGKSNTLLVLAREMILAGWAVAVIDPMNNFRKLRDSGLPVIVAGLRKSADVPLTNTAALAEFSFRQRASVVLETSMVEHEQNMETVEPFLRTLWSMVLTQDEDGPFVPYALFIDEAQMYIPQNGITSVTSLLNDMGKRGRQLHLSMVVSSQRLTSIQKDYVTQAHVRIFHKMVNIDVANFSSDMGMRKKDAQALMTRFVKGQAVVVADSDIAEMGEDDYVVCQIDEFGGAATPHAKLEMASDRQIDLGALRELLGKPVETETKEDAAMLRTLREKDALIRDLRTKNLQLEMESKRQAAVEIKQVEVSVLKDEHVEQLRKVAEEAIERGQALTGLGQELLVQMGKAQVRPAPVMSRSAPAPKVKPVGQDEGGDERLSDGTLHILETIARRHPTILTLSQVATLSGRSIKSSSFQSAISQLKRLGYIAGDKRGLNMTESGLDYLGDAIPSQPQTTDELIAMWRGALQPGAYKILEILVAAYPIVLTKQEVAARSEYSLTSSGFEGYLSLLRRNGLIERTAAGLIASDTLFIDVAEKGR